MFSVLAADVPGRRSDLSRRPKEILVSATPDYADSATSTSDPVSAPEVISQMADVAGAMFSLLLLRTLGSPAEEGIPLPAAAEPAEAPVALAASVDLSQASALPLPVPVIDLDPPPAPPILSIAMPSSLPVLDYVPEPVGSPAPPEPEYAFPVPPSAPPPPNMAMLSEIGFLDD